MVPASLSDMSLAERIRAHVIAEHIEPARGRGDRVVVVRAGDIHREMTLTNAMPSVCGAIGARRFAEAAQVALVERVGPRNGANVYFTFALDDVNVPRATGKVAHARQRTAVSPATRPRDTIDLAGSLVLVSCVKCKLSRSAPARELYTSDWFRKVRALIEAQDASWFILSALHGLVHPNTVIEPYERTLNTMGVADRRAWSVNVLQQLEPLLKSRPRVVFFAGERYREFLERPLRDRGIKVEVPMKGLSIGHQLSWLTITR